MGIEVTHGWFAEAVPQPTKKSFHVQLGCHAEEILESLDALTTESGPLSTLDNARMWLGLLAKQLKSGVLTVSVHDPKEFIDGLTDSVVTATGTAYMVGVSLPRALDVVNDSNWSKFVNGKAVFNDQGKIAKGSGYFKPDLSNVLVSYKFPV